MKNKNVIILCLFILFGSGCALLDQCEWSDDPEFCEKKRNVIEFVGEIVEDEK